MRSFAYLSLGLSLGLLDAGITLGQSQLEVRTSAVSLLAGADGLRTIGDVVLLTDTKEIEFTAGVLIEVTSPAANVEVDVTDRDRRRVDFVALAHEGGTTFYLVTAEGKSWVDVTAIDFAQNIYKRSTGNVIEVTKAGPAPSPTPEIPAPNAALQALASPIATKLSGDTTKAKSVTATFAGFAEAIRIVPVPTIAAFVKITQESVKSIGIAPGSPIGRDVDDLIATHMGVERDANRQWKDRPLTQADRDKAAEAFSAVAWAGGQVKQ